MYVDPNTNVYLLTRVPLDNTYQHTLYFSSESEQVSYFKSKIHIATAPNGTMRYEFHTQTYIDIEAGLQGEFLAEIEPHVADKIWKCNYIMFQNDIYQHKWFYGFITNIEMDSNRCWVFHFELDYLQSFMFDFDFAECWIERQHVLSDEIGEHTLPEPIDIGDIIVNTSERSFTMNRYCAVIATSFESGSAVATGAIYGGIYSGVKYYKHSLNNSSDIAALNEFLRYIGENNKAEAVAAFFMMPEEYFTDSSEPVVKTASAKRPTTIDGYTPRNKKLLCYPYNFLYVHDSCGHGINLKYELFDDVTRIEFSLESCASCNPEIICVPRHYKGENYSYNNKLVINQFPQIAFAYDTYKAWLAMNSGVESVKLGGMIGMTGAAIASGNYAGAVSLGLGALTEIESITAKSLQPPGVVGNQGGTAMVANKQLDFYFQNCSIKKEYARVIDDFFDRYGYNYQRNGVPHTHSRPHWNYVKTKGCTITGSLPAEVANKICAIMDAGITFWKNPSEVGNYSLDNTV